MEDGDSIINKGGGRGIKSKEKDECSDSSTTLRV